MSGSSRRRIAAWTVGGTVAGAALGLVCGVLYSFGGLIVDLLTVGLNGGTALAFLALLGMPAIFAFVGLLGGCALGVCVTLFHRWRGATK